MVQASMLPAGVPCHSLELLRLLTRACGRGSPHLFPWPNPQGRAPAAWALRSWQTGSAPGASGEGRAGMSRPVGSCAGICRGHCGQPCWCASQTRLSRLPAGLPAAHPGPPAQGLLLAPRASSPAAAPALQGRRGGAAGRVADGAAGWRQGRRSLLPRLPAGGCCPAKREFLLLQPGCFRMGGGQASVQRRAWGRAYWQHTRHAQAAA